MIPFDIKDASAFVHDALITGKLGPVDIALLAAFYQERNGLVVDGKPGKSTLEHLDKAKPSTVPAGLYLPPGLVDLRVRASKDKVYGRRTWENTTGITLHQTACVLGEREERWLNVGCHVGITRAGKILWLHDFDDLVVHGNGFNSQCVGFEIDGLYAGVDGDPKTVWDNPETAAHEQGMTPTPVQLEAVKHACRWVAHEVAHKGGKLKALVAHRQASDTRRNDPGSAIWKAVALPMMDELALSDGGVGFKIGDGYAIPEAWDPSRIGIRY